MANTPANGLKRPLNVLSNPIYPDIKSDEGLRFLWSRKHYNVDTGRTVSDAMQNIPQLVENAILFQSRAYNSQFAYGVSSHVDKVNEFFRPPLRTQNDTTFALSRLPRDPVTGRINPSLASDSQSLYAAQNSRPSEINAFLTDRVKKGILAPSFECLIGTTEDNSKLPELYSTLPETSASAGYVYPTQFDAPLPEPYLHQTKVNPYVGAGDSTNYRTATEQMINPSIELSNNIEPISVSANSGNTMRNIQGITPIDTRGYIDDNVIRSSASAGFGNTLKNTKGVTQLNNVEGFTFDDSKVNPSNISAASGFGDSLSYTRGVTSIDTSKYANDSNKVNSTSGASGLGNTLSSTHGVTYINTKEYEADNNRMKSSKTSSTAGYGNTMNNIQGITRLDTSNYVLEDNKLPITAVTSGYEGQYRTNVEDKYQANNTFKRIDHAKSISINPEVDYQRIITPQRSATRVESSRPTYDMVASSNIGYQDDSYRRGDARKAFRQKKSALTQKALASKNSVPRHGLDTFVVKIKGGTRIK